MLNSNSHEHENLPCTLSESSVILVHRYRNNYTTHLSASPSVQMKKPQRSSLRLRFFIWTLESASSAIGIVIYETMYWIKFWHP